MCLHWPAYPGNRPSEMGRVVRKRQVTVAGRNEGLSHAASREVGMVGLGPMRKCVSCIGPWGRGGDAYGSAPASMRCGRRCRWLEVRGGRGWGRAEEIDVLYARAVNVGIRFSGDRLAKGEALG